MALTIQLAGISLAGLFAGFAALQYNDPDAGSWMSIYLFAAGYCGVAAFRLPPVWLSLTLAGSAILAGIAFWPPEWTGLLDGGDGSQAAESARETLGLLLVAAALALVALAAKWQRALDR